MITKQPVQQLDYRSTPAKRSDGNETIPPRPVSARVATGVVVGVTLLLNGATLVIATMMGHFRLAGTVVVGGLLANLWIILAALVCSSLIVHHSKASAVIAYFVVSLVLPIMAAFGVILALIMMAST